MQIVADLHIHSKYSRAVSQKMDLVEIAGWAVKKGISLVAIPDWTHPLFFREIKQGLTEVSPGIFSLIKADNPELKKIRFIFATEISSIYTQGGKMRRIHNLIFSPSVSTAEKIITKFKNHGFNLMSDGRPIIGLSAKGLLELILTVDQNCLLVPCHCLPPKELIETKNGLKEIGKITLKDYVLSHTGEYRKVEQVFKRKTHENLYTITPWYYSQGIQTTGEHPYLAIKTIKKCPSDGNTCLHFGAHPKRCSKKTYENYKKEWIPANKLEKKDFICFPIISKTINKEFINYNDLKIKIDDRFCLLIGYYLAEGCVDNKWGITYTFSSNEKKYVNDVIKLMKDVFGITHSRVYKRKDVNSIEIMFYSKKTVQFIIDNFYVGKIRRAPYKTIPNWMIYLPIQKQKQLLIGWFRGDSGYTSSKNLVSAINKICLRMGIVPYISVNSKESFNTQTSHYFKGRKIISNYDNYQIKLSFIKNPLSLNKEKEFKRFKTKIARRHGYMDDNYLYLPVRKIQINKYVGDVYNLEVEKDHSYVTWVSAVHNCWTPWFSLYGSKSGFDSIEECFGELSNNIYAVETGLSSDPIMNWQIKDLDNRSIVSSSDAHSGPKIGREATVFIPTMKQCNNEAIDFSYKDITDAIKQKSDRKLKIGYTIEFFPEEGKYHWSGHRSCNVRYTPREVKEKGTICPKCGKPLTIGVENRVVDLSEKILDKKDLLFLENKAGLTFVYDKEKKRVPFVSLIPLIEILTETNNGSPTKALMEYEKLTTEFASEFDILLKKPLEEIGAAAGKKLRTAVEIIRKRQVFVDPGYDGVFGAVKIFGNDNQPGEKKSDEEKQPTLF